MSSELQFFIHHGAQANNELNCDSTNHTLLTKLGITMPNSIRYNQQF